MGMKEDLAEVARLGTLCDESDHRQLAMNAGFAEDMMAARLLRAHHAEIQRNQEAAARYKFICDAFDHMKTSKSERFLECLSIDDGVDVCLPLDTIISTAMRSTNGGKE
jgi:hypothetical protein